MYIGRYRVGCPKLLVLDDPLAAVDATVAQQIFNRAILGTRVHNEHCSDSSLGGNLRPLINGGYLKKLKSVN